MRLFDSNILIYYLNGAYTPEQKRQIDEWADRGAFITIITRTEVLGFPMSDERRAEAEEYVVSFSELPLTDAIVGQAIRIRQIRWMGLPDAVIAATALHHGLPLATRNEHDFRAIPGLILLNPFSA